jgi:thioredoxin-related protein
MKNSIKSNILIIIILAISVSLTAQPSKNFKDGLADGKSSNKKILVSIYNPEDSWSKKMESVYSSGKISSLITNNFVFVKLNGTGGEKYSYNGKEYTAGDLAKYLGATGYPTHSFLNPDGSIIKFKYNCAEYNGFPGYLDEAEFEKLLNFFISGKYGNSDLSKEL